MKRFAIAAVALSASAAWAQAPAVPEQKCEPKPRYPGLQTLKSDVEVKAFEAQIKAYKECIMAYISERRAATNANNSAANAAADEHNKVMEKIRADQEAARQEAENARAADKKDNVTSPGVKPR